MRNVPLSVGLGALIALTASQSVSAGVLFHDTFNVSMRSADVNFEIASRQSGSMVPPAGVSYSENGFGGNDWRTQVSDPGGPNQLLLGPDRGLLEAMVSPNLSFSSVTDPVVISLQVDPVTGDTSSMDWSMLRAGLSDATRAVSVFAEPILGGGGIAVLVRSNGGVQVFSGGANIADASEDVSNASRQGLTSIELTLSNITGGPGVASLMVGGSLVDLDPSVNVSTTFAYSSLAGGYMQTIAYTAGNSEFKSYFADNWMVEAIVPEPATALLLGSAAPLLLIRRRTAGRR